MSKNSKLKQEIKIFGSINYFLNKSHICELYLLEKDSYEETSTELIIYQPPVVAFDLELKVIINPFENSSLEGLY